MLLKFDFNLIDWELGVCIIYTSIILFLQKNFHKSSYTSGISTSFLKVREGTIERHKPNFLRVEIIYVEITSAINTIITDI